MESRKPKQLYSKLFRIYTAIAAVVVIVLASYFLIQMQRNILEQKMETAQRICDEAAQYVEDQSVSANDLYTEIYRNKSLLNDMLNFLTLEPEAYQAFRLDEYSASNNIQYSGMQSFVTDAFETYSMLKRVEFLSYGNRELTTYYSQDVVFPYKDGRQRLRELTGDGNYGQGEELQFMKELRNTDTMEVKGCIVFTFYCKNYVKIPAAYREYIDVLLVRNYKNLIHSTGDEKWTREIMKKGERQEKVSIPDYQVYREQADDFQVYVMLDKAKAAYVEPARFLAITGVSLAALAVGIFLINLYLRRLDSRVGNIIRGMEQVTTGDLKVRLYVDEKGGDELDIIAGNFNSMCENLQTYIQKSYIAEIEAKNAELDALQSQINPHFLYNTLEAIRMKAIVNGDREVGKMLYSMSVLFRSQLKEADWITIGQELDYCKQYLELFECRYQGNFVYKFDCPVELLATRVIKFILQPILENYFVHGIRRQEADNYIYISAKETDGDIVFRVENNGSSMKEKDIAEKNRELRENRSGVHDRKKSVGITNVNRRIKTVYGDSYGITMESCESGGVRVLIKVRLTP